MIMKPNYAIFTMPRNSEHKKRGRGPPTALVPVGTDGTSAPVPAQAPTLQELRVELTPLEEAFARNFVLYTNATRAYVEAAQYPGKRATARVLAWEMSNRPHVLQRVREYESAAAAAIVIDYAAILDHDRQIVEGHKYADQITQHVWQCCRYCYGVDHKYQWIDYNEYLVSLSKAEEANEARRARKLGDQQLPDECGGYGFDVQAEPNFTCPHCEGRGHSVTVIADTTKLSGPARAIVKGVRVTASGTEVLFHDVDKAKERLLRAAGMFKDDAASVARGAAAGAAAGATAAIAAVKAAEQMTSEQAQRLYLELA